MEPIRDFIFRTVAINSEEGRNLNDYWVIRMDVVKALGQCWGLIPRKDPKMFPIGNTVSFWQHN